MRTRTYLLRHLRTELHSLALAYACMLLFALATTFLAFLSGPALSFVFSNQLHDVLLTPNGKLRGMWQLLPAPLLHTLLNFSQSRPIWVVPTLLLATALLKGAAQTGQLYLMGRSSQRLLHNLRLDAFRALLEQPLSFYNQRAQGDLLSRISHDAQAVEQAFYYGAGPLLRDSLSVLMLLSFCVATDARLALLTLVSLPLGLLLLRRFSHWLKRVSQVSQAALGHITSVCHEALAGIHVVQAFHGEAYEVGRLQRASLAYQQQMRRGYAIRAVRAPITEVLGTAALAALLALLGYQVRQRGADPAHYISFFAAMIMLYDPLKKLGGVSDYLAIGSAALTRLREMSPPAAALERAPAKPLRADAALQDAVVLQSLSFAYTDTPVLRDINLRIQVGEVVALVGASGSGKSTLAQLLLRFYDVQQGAIYFDGIDSRQLSRAALRRQIGWVGQDTFLFNTTVAANIAYACPTASRARIVEAAQAAQADAFIRQLPQGYETRIGERGVLLSGGQRQRLAIARALLANRPLLILDEASSHLDVESEHLLQQALATLLQQRTALVIAHRLSTVRQAHRIAVLKDGRILESGSHAHLLQRQGEYARLYALQFNDAPAPVNRRTAPSDVRAAPLA